MDGTRKRLTAHERFWKKVNRSGGPDACWPWTGGTFKQNSYGVFHPSKRETTTAHRWAYEEANGEITDGSHVDHECHNGTGCPGGKGCPHRLCCNPRHLRAKHPVANVKASHNANHRKTHCPRGHEYTPENTRRQVRTNTAGRSCKTCARNYDARRSPGPRKVNPIDPARVRALYAQGAGASAIARELGVSLARLYAVFDEIGLARRGVGRVAGTVACNTDIRKAA